MATQISHVELNIAEQFRRIEQLVADVDARNAERLKADREWKFLPWQLLASGLTRRCRHGRRNRPCLSSLLNEQVGGGRCRTDVPGTSVIT